MIYVNLELNGICVCVPSNMDKFIFCQKQKEHSKKQHKELKQIFLPFLFFVYVAVVVYFHSFIFILSVRC
jgi:glycopeptide antibiotics resistance protein